MKFSRRVARFNKLINNRVQGVYAWLLPPWAVIHHRGRRSGRPYRTPLLAFKRDHTVIIALLYGEESDWLRNPPPRDLGHHVTGPLSLPEGFSVGHWTDSEARTGCTVVICPPGTRGAVEVRGGGASTRELEALGPLANAEGPTAVLLTGGSAFGLAAADGVVRWLSERGRGRVTGLGPPVPLVPAAVIFDLTEHDVRPGAGGGYA